MSTSSDSLDWYAFNPTITSLPLSMLACLFAAASSILIFGSPNSIALVIPP